MTTYSVSAEGLPTLNIEDPHLRLDLTAAWAVLADADGTVLAIPTARVRSIIRTDETPQDAPEPAP